MVKPFAMIIEDDRDTVALFRHVLDFAGYKTEIILQGEKALDRLAVAKPDIVLLDLSLPGVSGMELLSFIRSEEHLKDIPVIVVTGNPHMAMGLQQETDLILLKPVSIDQLTNLILRLSPTETKLPIEPPRDSHTGLYNRSFFTSRLGYSIERTTQLDGSIFGILYFDYDNFSELCKKRGEEFCDQVLVETARFLNSLIRPIDTISRFDYDHFLIQIEDLITKDILAHIATRIHSNLGPYMQEKFGITLTASIGMVYCGADYLWAEDILRDADIALHFAKQEGPGSLVTFNPITHFEYRAPEKYATIMRIGLAPGDRTKPR